MTSSFKNDWSEIRLTNWYWYANNGWKGSSRLNISINRYATTNNKYIRDYDKNAESSYLKYWDVNSLNGCAMSQKLPVNSFGWVEDFSNLMKTL